jgi:F-type H+-transporting ATPase subunit gamma
MRQLGAVVNAMRGIAAARSQQARIQLAAVDSYAVTVALAIGQILDLVPAARLGTGRRLSRMALVLFCAEQGFAGAFSERVLDAIDDELSDSELFVVGTRGNAIMAERGIAVDWNAAMPSHSLGIPKLADQITEALLARVASGKIDRLDAVFSEWRPGRGVHIERRRLFPLDMPAFTGPASSKQPLLNMTPETLLIELTAEYLHAELCNTTLHAFAAENEARMEAMAAARTQVERQLSALQATERIVRQEEITAEIIELAAGETASRSGESRQRIA